MPCVGVLEGDCFSGEMITELRDEGMPWSASSIETPEGRASANVLLLEESR